VSGEEVKRGGWLLRAPIVLILAAAITLGVLVQPLLETPPPALTPTLTLTPTSTSTPTLTPTPTPTPPPSPTPTPTPPPSPTPTPTSTLTPAPTSTPTPARTETTSQLERHTYFSQTAGGEQSYRIHLPPGYDQSDRRYPVLYLLHGWPYDEAHWDSLGADEAADAGIATGILPPFIIVLPRGSERLYVNTSGGDRSFEGQLVNDLIPHVDATYRTWASREGRAIGGMSRGGVWALEIGFLHPDLFAAVGAHSPALSVNLAPPPYDPFNLLGEPGVTALRIYLDAGDADWARESTQALHEALAGRGIAHEFVVHPGRHENGLWAANVAEYLAFYAAGW
jgi:enterochelin esterase-like enzyme